MEVFKEIAKKNRQGMSVYALPFRVGFGAAFLAGFVSIPLVFHEETSE